MSFKMLFLVLLVNNNHIAVCIYRSQDFSPIGSCAGAGSRNILCVIWLQGRILLPTNTHGPGNTHTHSLALFLYYLRSWIVSGRILMGS